MKFSDIKTLTNPSDEGIPGPPAGGDDFLGRIQSALDSFKQAMQLMKELRGLPNLINEPAPDSGDNKPAKRLNNPMLGQFLAKYSDMTVEQAFDTIKPLTIKQLMEMIQHGIRPGK